MRRELGVTGTNVCGLRTPAPGELAKAAEVLGPMFEALRFRMMRAGLRRIARTSWRLDEGPRSGRHFASCSDDGLDVLIHPETVLLPRDKQKGILAHELGHAADGLYPGELSIQGGELYVLEFATDEALERWHARTADQIERFADRVAASALGELLGYEGPCHLQTIGAGTPRPRGLR